MAHYYPWHMREPPSSCMGLKPLWVQTVYSYSMYDVSTCICVCVHAFLMHFVMEYYSLWELVLVCIGMAVKRTMYQCEYMLADIFSISPLSEQRAFCLIIFLLWWRANARNVSQHTLWHSAYPHQPYMYVDTFHVLLNVFHLCSYLCVRVCVHAFVCDTVTKSTCVYMYVCVCRKGHR